jgi:hypothetical protein
VYFLRIVKAAIIAIVFIGMFPAISRSSDTFEPKSYTVGPKSFVQASGVGKCVGNACSSVAVNWTNPGYDIVNNSSRPVTVIIRFAIGWGQCIAPATFPLGPHQSVHRGNNAFCDPYSANYR